jgi:cytochrome c oxidase assembly factor CtaG
VERGALGVSGGEVVLVAELVAAGATYGWAAGRVRRWPARRCAAFAGGLAVVAAALVGLDAPAHRSLGAHMAQHVLLVFGAAPLLVLGSPVALALRATGGRARRALGLGPLAHPAFGLAALAVVMAGTHFTGVFAAALAHPALHAAEHVAYLGAAALFWRPVLGADPVPGRPGPVGRLLYLMLASGPLSLVGVAMDASRRPWYAAYPSLSDQHTAGAIMWVGGGLALAAITVAAVWAALQREHRRRLEYERRMEAAA